MATALVHSVDTTIWRSNLGQLFGAAVDEGAGREWGMARRKLISIHQ
jgi:hypothetical protein